MIPIGCVIPAYNFDNTYFSMGSFTCKSQNCASLRQGGDKSVTNRIYVTEMPKSTLIELDQRLQILYSNLSSQYTKSVALTLTEWMKETVW